MKGTVSRRLLDDLGPRLDSRVNSEPAIPYRALTQLHDNIITVNTGDYRSPSQDMSLYNQAMDKATQMMNQYSEPELLGSPFDYTGRARAALDSYCSSCSD